ncbi:MAG TPA: aminotransferase class I/II-fold pyridoxal phosphate-dependent enzyme [Candidatus Dormibacteraeota bacterium]|nr:aminotransferase class I/II-fold pyridoxal phosphate-dependent enzyme [Candidatus Dormibacteraeota bacterium]
MKLGEPQPLQQVDRTFVRIGKRKLSYFAGCDYFRMASDPRTLQALAAGLKKYGLSVAASRLTTGNHKIFRELEEALAKFFDAEDVLLTSGGYMTNFVVAQGLAGNFSHALIDERSHPSLGDAARFLDCPILKFKHQDPADLKRAVERCGPGTKLLVMTDGMFSHDGSVAPLAAYTKLLPRDAWMLVDDAHGGGVVGKTGKGSLEASGVPRRQVIQTITLSKAFGAYGGGIVATKAIRQKLIAGSKLFAGSTPLPLPLAAAALKSIALLRKDRTFLRRLNENAAYLKTKLVDREPNLNFQGLATPGPIVSVLPSDPRQTFRVRKSVLEADVFPSIIRYPGGPASGYFRFVISSRHTRGQLDALASALTARTL